MIDPASPRPRLRLGVRIGVFVVGWILILVGVAGLVLPGIQGVLTIILGAALLSLDNELIYRLMRRAFLRWPHLWDKVERLREWRANQAQPYAHATCYSDSRNDLPLLLEADTAVAVEKFLPDSVISVPPAVDPWPGAMEVTAATVADRAARRPPSLYAVPGKPRNRAEERDSQAVDK